MRAIGRLILLVVVVIVGIFFVGKWRSTTPLGYGTGNYAGNSAQAKSDDDLNTKTRSRFSEIVNNPESHANKRITLTGRVYGTSKYASNRNIYSLTALDNSDVRVLVIDDKTPPQDYNTRTVSGTLKLIGPKVGGHQNAYLVDVKDPIRFTPPQFAQVKQFFSQKYRQVASGVQEEIHNQ